MSKEKINAYGDYWVLVEDMYFSTHPIVTGVYCGVTEVQLRDEEYMKRIGLKSAVKEKE